MQYMLFCCFDEARWNALPEGQRDEIMQAYGAWAESLGKSGHYRGGAKLDSIATATTLRAKAGKVAVTDGPFAETKEHLGGFHIVECGNLDEALALASRIPTIPFGGAVEVRPVLSQVGG